MAKDDIEPEELDEEIEMDGEELEDLDGDLDDESMLDGDESLDDEDDDESMGATIVRKAGDDEDDEDDMVAPDDVEEDLAAILDDRLKAEDVQADEDDVIETDDRSGADDALQPKRADEVQCSVCFLLVRPNAPACPMSDDTCPVFVNK